MYPSSKLKSSFRIEDILHQQRQQQQQQHTDSQLLAHHLMLKSSVQPSELSRKSETNSRTDLSRASKSPSPGASPIPEISPEHGHFKSDGPMKPTPMYTNFPMPFPLGIHPAFHPAAAYLNYADAIHKGERREANEHEERPN
jgi:hypothetical protein